MRRKWDFGRALRGRFRAAPRGSQPAAPDEATERPDDQPVRKEPPPGRCVGEPDPRFSRELSSLRAEVQRDLCKRPLARSEPAQELPGAPVSRERAGRNLLEAQRLHLSPDRAIQQSRHAAETKQHTQERRLRRRHRLRRRERALRRSAGANRMPLAVVELRKDVLDRDCGPTYTGALKSANQRVRSCSIGSSLSSFAFSSSSSALSRSCDSPVGTNGQNAPRLKP